MVSKLTWWILRILTRALKNLKNIHFLKVNKHKGVVFDGAEDWCKIWKKTDFQKSHEKFGDFLLEH